MATKKRGDIDLSSFVPVKPSGILANKNNTEKKKKGADQPKAVSKKAKAPWQSNDIVAERNVDFLIKITEADREMLRYIRKVTGASASHTLRTMSLLEMRKLADKLFEENGQNI